MLSPLPDSSALEAGIIEDSRPTRLSRVQDNVRNLLRASFIGSVRGSTVTPQAHQATVEDEAMSPLHSSLHSSSRAQAEVLHSPSSASNSWSSPSNTRPMAPDSLPSANYQRQVQHMAHQSTLFNTRAVAALNHPDLSDPSLALFLQQKSKERQRHAWRRSKNRRLRHANKKSGNSRWLICVVAALLLIATVVTYLVVATSENNLSPTFHILFVLGILLATIVFAHSFVRACFFRPSSAGSPKIRVIQNGRLVRSRRRRHGHHRRQHQIPSSETAHFNPLTPIPVQVIENEVRPDSQEAEPSASVQRASQAWNKDVSGLPQPPPAYGRWRGSVRANPDLLHWQAIPSPVDPDTPVMPSPTYEEATRDQQANCPPSYVTRDSPARRCEIQEAREELGRTQVVQPEMFEGRGIGIAE